MSPVTFTTPSSPVAYEEDNLVTVAELGSYLGFDLSADAAATLAVNAASDYCRTMAEQTFTEVSNDTIYLDGTGTDALLLPQLPVTRVRSVKDGTDVITDWELTDNALLVRKGEFSSLTWPVGRQRYTVAYDHGYEEVPADVRMVALSIAARLIIQGTALSEGRGQDSIRYAVANTDLTAGERMILRRYKTSR